MALPSSGQISISDVLTEGGQSSTRANTSLRDLEDGNVFTVNNISTNKPNGSTPNALSEWYSYDHSAASSTKYWDMSGTTSEIRWTGANFENGSDTVLSVSFWFRIDLSTKDNILFWDLYPSGASTNANRLFFQYAASSNAFIARYRSNSTNFDRQWQLHSTGNGTTTGVTNSTTGLATGQRGNVNSDNFVHLVFVYDGGRSTPTSAFKVYWNATELTNEFTNNSGTRTNFSLNEFVFGNDYNGGAGDNSAYDEMTIYTSALSQSDITAIYNSGAPANTADTNITDNLFFEDVAETATPADNTGTWALDSSSGTITSY